MSNWLKLLLGLALAAVLCSCGATGGPTAALDSPTPNVTSDTATTASVATTPSTDSTTARGTSSWIGDECGAKPKGGGLISSLLGALLGTSSGGDSGSSSNSGSGSSDSGSGSSGSGS